MRIQEVHDLRVALPAHAEFLRADLTRDPSADLARAEHEQPAAARAASPDGSGTPPERVT